MFQDREARTGVEVASSWRMSVSVSEATCQTMPCTTAEVSCQVRDVASIEVQTEAGDSDKSNKVDEAALAKFVTEAAIMIEDELESIALSRAWEGFNGYGLDDEDDDTEVTLVKHVDTKEGWKVGSLSWNNLDSRVVSSLVEDHSDWCSHPARVHVYSVDRNGDLRQDDPTLVLTTQSCITVVTHSRHDTSVLAAGSWTGEVVIYRTDREAGEAEIMSSVGGEGRDTDNHAPVVALLWLSRNSLVSVHSSGTIRLFTADMRKYQLVLKKTYVLTATHLPRSLKPLRSGEVGIVNAEVSDDDPSNVILSTEAGCVVMTDLNSELTLAPTSADSEVTYYDPVMAVYQLHHGAITAMALSTYDDNILATAGEDLRLLLMSVTSPQPPSLVYQLDKPVSHLSWSPTRPSLLAAASNRFVLLFDTIQASSGPILRVRHTERNVSLPITATTFPNKDGSRIVSTDKYGRIYFWRLPQYLNTSTIQEKNMFQNIPYSQ